MPRLLIVLLLAVPTIASAAGETPPVSTALPQPAPATTLTVPPAEPAATTQGTRIGYVDISRIAGESARGKALKTLLIARKEQLQGKLDARKKQIEKLKSAIEAKIANMTPQQRDAKAKEFQKKLDEFQKFARTSEEELYTLQEKETKDLFTEVEKAATAHGTANKFAAIVIKKELLYIGSAVDAQDVTDALIKAMNEAGQKK
jgi:outer membrane protein